MRILLLGVCVLLLAGCPQQQGQSSAGSGNETAPVATGAGKQPASSEVLAVWIDPALQPALEAVAPEFKKLYAPGYKLVAIERGELLDKLADSLEPPAVVCADRGVLEAYAARGVVDEGTLRTFAGDRLVLAERPGQGFKSSSLFDVYELRFEHIGLGEPGTLAGYFGEQALISEGGFERIEKRIKRYPSSVALVDALKLDEVQMILVPASTAAVSGISAWLLIGEDVHEDILYQAAAGEGCPAKPGVMELLRFLAEDEHVQLQLEGYGLTDRAMALVEDK